MKKQSLIWRTAVAITVAGSLSSGVALRQAQADRAAVGGWIAAEEAYSEAKSDDSNGNAIGSNTTIETREKVYRHLVRSTALDLYETGSIGAGRARGIAGALVQEAYNQDVPLALLIGIMRVENTTFRSQARSFVGATGLMQIMPDVWTPVFGSRFGYDLGNDQTNIRYGAAILRDNLLETRGDWRKALLHYNGCRVGANTRNCMSYPDLVLRAVQRDAAWTCRGFAVDRCIAERGRIGEYASIGDEQ